MVAVNGVGGREISAVAYGVRDANPSTAYHNVRLVSIVTDVVDRRAPLFPLHLTLGSRCGRRNQGTGPRGPRHLTRATRCAKLYYGREVLSSIHTNRNLQHKLKHQPNLLQHRGTRQVEWEVGGATW